MNIKNSTVIDNPMNLQRFEYIDYPEDTVIQLACVARLEVEFKGQDILLQTLSHAKWRSKCWCLNFYGEGDDLMYLNELTRHYDLSDKVVFCGYQPDVREIWKSNHALILPSLAEGKPLALQEAMICGRVSITTDVAGISEIVTDNITGFIVEAPTPRLLDSAMSRAWERINDWQAMGLSAHEWSIKNIDRHPEKRIVEQVINE